MYPEDTGVGSAVPIARPPLLNALGRAVHAFMGLRWTALELYAAITREHPSRGATLSDPALVALRLQAAAHELTRGGARRDVIDWADAFAACADLHTDLLRSRPGATDLRSLPTDTPERLSISDGPVDLLTYAERFDALAAAGRGLRRRLPAG